MFRGLVFDFDGVVVDSHPVHKRAWERFLDSVGRVASEEELQFVLDGRTRDDILRHFLGDLDTAKIVEYGHQKEQFFREEAADVQTIKGLRTFLDTLEEAELALGIASSGSRGRVDFLLDRLNLKKHFRVVVTGDEVAHGKPHPAVFLKAAQRLRTDPCDLIAFEDAFSGVKAAKSAGMMCIGIAQPDHASILLDAGATHVVPDFQSLSYSKLQEIFRSALRSAIFASANNLAGSLPD
jgi:HAD superfamily hydrolase (TIGR01509 family)